MPVENCQYSDASRLGEPFHVELLLRARHHLFTSTSWFGMARCAVAPSENARESGAALKKRSRKCSAINGTGIPALGRHHSEETGGEVAAQQSLGSRAVCEQGFDGQGLVVTPRKRPKVSAPESGGKEVKASKGTRLGDGESRIREGDCTTMEVDVQGLDRSAASTQDLVTEWLQKNPKKDGSKSWQRYEKYKNSGTIRQAFENGCTWVDVHYDGKRGHLKITAAASGTGSGNQNKKVSTKLVCRAATGAASRNKGIGLHKEEVRPSSRRRRIRGASVPLSKAAKKCRHRGPATGWGHIGNDNGEANGPPENVSHSSVGTQQPGHSKEAATFVEIKDHVPLDVQDAVSRISPKAWTTKSTAEYRRCRSLHFGLGLVRFPQGHIGRGSREFTEIQKMILKHLISIQPGLCFSSFIVSRCEVGDQMGRHVDNNMLCQSMQLVLVWGDFKGGDLVIYDKGGTRIHAVIGPAILLMDGNAQHEVTPVTCGTRYSIVTYAKHTFPKCTEHVREQIRQFGFPLPTLRGPRSVSVRPQCPSTHHLGQTPATENGEYERGLAVQLLDHVEHQCNRGRGRDAGTMESCVFFDHMQRLRKSGLFCDLVLISGGSYEKCHQCLVAATSLALHNYLVTSITTGDVMDSPLMHINVDDPSSSAALSIVVDHMYGVDVRARLREESSQCLIDVFKLALGWELFSFFQPYQEILKERIPQFDATTLLEILRGTFALPVCRLRRKLSCW